MEANEVHGNKKKKKKHKQRKVKQEPSRVSSPQRWSQGNVCPPPPPFVK